MTVAMSGGESRIDPYNNGCLSGGAVFILVISGVTEPQKLCRNAIYSRLKKDLSQNIAIIFPKIGGRAVLFRLDADHPKGGSARL